MDYRTEVFGLMRAQMTKNAVIVPDGAKGGFFLRRRPDDPAALKAEVERGYVPYIAALLDLTDNLVDGEVVHPEGVRVHDEDDTYLVVAADKGTATFSDTANESPGATGSGWATRSLRAARRATTTRRWASPPAAHGSRSSATSASSDRPGGRRVHRRRASATCPATSSATGCC